MDFKQIQELIKMVNKTEIGELSIEQKDFKITIKQKQEHVTHVINSTPQLSQAAHAPQQIQSTSQQALAGNVTQQEPLAATPQTNYVTIKSPMIGTYYRRPSPDKPNFVEVGDEVVPGKVVCIIEAMKLFNEIESEVKGKVVKLLVEDASPVEYDQPLYLVEPS